MVPTIGLDVEIISVEDITLEVMNDGGRSVVRAAVQKFYYRDTYGLIFVVDSTDRERIDEARDTLHQLLNEEELRNKPILIFANKQDLSNSMSFDELRDKLNLTKLNGNTKWHLHNGVTTVVRLVFYSYGPFPADPIITTETSTSTTTTATTSNVTNNGTYTSPKPRALVSIDAKSVVGILFDDIPMDARDVAKRLLDEKNDDYWLQLATQQMQYTQVRLIFRPTYYEDIEPPTKRCTLSLTLPEFFEIKFLSSPYFATIDDHYLYVRNYTFHNILITDADSLAESDDRLTQINGSMTETFNMPVDPFLVVQRTGFACMGEAQWTPNSVDAETTEIFYDDTCDVEEPQAANLTGCQQCHCTYPLPNVSCVDALKQSVGHIEFDIVFKRIPDDPVLADQWRFPKEGPSINAFGEVAATNLFEYKPALTNIRFIYLYIEPDGCEIAEKCVTGSG
ncbi:unnamed protein product [Rotaria sordida]|uniref:Uncharacterized protein n=1 Tax=Rotaria sordida TaxID=392033 RepID=A0A815KSG7_9BILA|nr:unnamed protein product [Rotaria sordida]